MVNVTVQMVDVQCYGCAMTYAIPSTLNDKALRLKESYNVYCPLGHLWHYVGQSDEQKISDLKFQLQQKDNLIADERREKERLEKRIRKGVCPYCKRLFGNLAAHMACKHKRK